MFCPAPLPLPLQLPARLTRVPGLRLLRHPHEVSHVQLAHRVGHTQPLKLSEQLGPVPRPAEARLGQGGQCVEGWGVPLPLLPAMSSLTP